MHRQCYLLSELNMFDQAKSPSSSDLNRGINLPSGVMSPAIQRLLQEVRNKESLQAVGGKYDRTHNRHNRGQ